MTVARWVLTGTLALAVACGGKAEDTGGDTGTAGDGVHPFVPEGYEYLWDTDGCDDGAAGVYHLASGTSDDDNLALTETWYWFFGEDDYEGDCYDTFEFNGVKSNTTWGGTEPCSECEEEWSGAYKKTDGDDNACNFGYGGILVDDSDYTSSDFNAIFYLDTLTPSGNPNEDNAALVIALWEGSDGWFWDSNYGRGEVYPEEKGDYYGPSEYQWVNGGGQICVTFSR